jgi:crotonobetainyl-CoA:carnitine CoA-transferase CaiB-like acyl-CoA transferase
MRDAENILSGIRVVEVASMVMVPSAGAVLAEYGADVIKVEPLRGDLNRRGHLIPGMPDSEHEYCFFPDNRNKRSLAVDLKSEGGRKIVRRLVERADVFLTNYRRRALERLGLSWDQLGRESPRLVYAHGTGYGDRGGEADQPGFDAVCYWSRSALEYNMFPDEGWLRYPSYGSGDHPSGMSLFGAVMLALFRRQRTGRGGRVTTSLLANGAWANAVTIQARLCDAVFHPRRPRENAINFTGVYYRAGCGRIFKIVLVDVEAGWPRVCRAIGRPDLIDDPRYATVAARAPRMGELVGLCDEIFARRDMSHWQETFARHDVPFSLIATYDDVVADRQMVENGIFVEVENGAEGGLRTVTSPVLLDQQPKVSPVRAPRLGEHSLEVLRELAFDDGEVECFVDAGVVASG